MCRCWWRWRKCVALTFDISGAHCLQSATTLVRAVLTSQIDYCNVVFVEAIKSVANQLQQVLNAAARVVSGTRKFNHGLTQLLYADLHWLERVKYKLLHDDAPMPGRHCSTVSDSTLGISLWDCVATASSFGYQPPTDSSACTSAGNIRWSDVRCRRSVDVELTAETFTLP